ncbi:tRNA (adenosine(37)-N6)-threonylcarbamoyltransferase complex dimerization subunit type 1 TsaB [Candidatus Margulisiibacteriota bacterium]
MFLGINLAVEPFSLGLLKDGQLIAELNTRGSFSFTENLVLEIERFLQNSNHTIRQLKGIGIINGPGSYTGLRVSVTVAKSLAQVLSIPVYPIDSLEALVIGKKSIPGIYFSLLPARKKEYNCALFACQNNNIKRITESIG